jgi:hypothetical protein
MKGDSDVEKRKQVRFTVQFRSTFSANQQEGEGRTVDLSLGGCKIESNAPVVAGTKYEMRLYVPGFDWPLRIEEAYVRWTKVGVFGVEFMGVRPEEQTKLRTLVKQLKEELNR